MKMEKHGAVGSSFLDIACDPDAPTASLPGVQMAEGVCLRFEKRRGFSKIYWNTTAS